MIISHKHRYVFVEVPHTGSHSIASELIEFYAGEKILRKHANYTQFLAQASRDEKQYFAFGTVRNPLDTAVTDYSKLESNHRGQFTNPDMLIANGGHITDQHLKEYAFVQSEQSNFTRFMQTFRSNVYHNWFLIGAERFNFVMRLETLGTDYQKLIQALGLELVRPLPHVNPTKKKGQHFEEYFVPELHSFAGKYYGPFMRRWDYPFPASWGDVNVPISSLVRYYVLDRGVSLAARFAKLDPDNPRVKRIKKFVESF